MENASLTIRNLTSTSIELKLVERFEGVSNITRSLSNLMRSPTSPSAAQLDSHVKSFSTQDVSLKIEAFKTSRMDIKMTEGSKHEITRLTFENDGERYRLDTPTPNSESSTLMPLTPKPRFQYTAIYLPEYSHLTLLSSSNLNSWMRELKDETPLSGLSIPGTHNSPTCHRALPSVRCQAVSPRVQLENGVRFFDIRVQVETPQDPTKDGLVLVHSVFPISLSGTKYFRDLVKEVFEFLDQNPSETLIMSIKREGTGNGTDAQLGRILRDHYAGDVHQWFTAPHIPTLGEARHKIVVIRRFSLEDGLKSEWEGAGWCINAETWPDNTANGTCPSGDICVQDFYEVLDTENIEKKIEYSEAHLNLAGKCVCPLPGINVQNAEPPTKEPFYINFLSASNFWKVRCWPEKIAAKLNPSIVTFLCTKHHESQDPNGTAEPGNGSTGIVVCDWVGNNGNWDLVRCIVGMNAKLELREKTM
ncbi:hypothetical protein MMC14_005157 [Varicellaria rhodocarpa]|nr:hypothetical protein [Varicellaria rhodocarpa]